MRNSEFPHPLRLLACLLLAFGLCAPAVAGDKDAAKEQARRLQEQKRQLESEKRRLQQENTELSGKLADAQAVADKQRGLSASLEDSRRRLRQAGERSERLAAEVGELKAGLAARDGEIEKLRGQLAGEQAARNQAEKETAGCVARNEALYVQGRTLLQAFGRHGACDAVAQAEPLFGLARVERENLLESQRDAIEAQQPPVRKKY